MITAIGRELLGFIWAIGVHVEVARRQRETRRRVTERGAGNAVTVVVERHTEWRILD